MNTGKKAVCAESPSGRCVRGPLLEAPRRRDQSQDHQTRQLEELAEHVRKWARRHLRSALGSITEIDFLKGLFPSTMPPRSVSGLGSSEVTAARQRLAVAKKWEASAACALEADERRLRDLKEQVKITQRQVEDAREEVKEATAYLEGVERKYKVIDLDDGESPVGQKTRKKPRLTVSSDGHAKIFHHVVSQDPLGLVVVDSAKHPRHPTVEQVLEDSQLVGVIQNGDEILQFDGVNTENMSFAEFAELTRTRLGDRRRITFQRTYY